MRKTYKELTEDQKKRGIIFSSQLMPDDNSTIHEVHEDDEDKDIVISRLKDDKFFNNRHYKYNLIKL